MPIYEFVSKVMKQDCINVALVQGTEVELLLPSAFLGKRYKGDGSADVIAIGKPIWSDNTGETEVRDISTL